MKALGTGFWSSERLTLGPCRDPGSGHPCPVLVCGLCVLRPHLASSCGAQWFIEHVPWVHRQSLRHQQDGGAAGPRRGCRPPCHGGKRKEGPVGFLTLTSAAAHHSAQFQSLSESEWKGHH